MHKLALWIICPKTAAARLATYSGGGLPSLSNRCPF
jgi:hypothetical protein